MIEKNRLRSPRRNPDRAGIGLRLMGLVFALSSLFLVCRTYSGETRRAWNFPEGLPRIHVARGLWWDLFDIYESGALMGGAIYDGSYDVFGSSRGYCGHGRPLGGFPGSRKRLEKFNTIVIVGCRVGALSKGVQQRLVQWVHAGGGLLVTGGYHGFGQGGYHGSPLERVLPVEVSSKPDLTRLPARNFLEPTPSGLDLYGDAIPWRHRPLLYYIHSPLQVRDGARVLIKAAGHPVLVRGKSGKGRVSVFAGTVCGERQPGDLPFWVWDGWPMILSRELAWLVKTPDAPRAKERITSRDAGYRKRLQELRKLTDVDLSAFGDEDDALAIGTPGGSGKPTSARILRLARHTTSREYALAVVKAVAESGTHIEPRGANAIFGQIEEHVVGSGFIQPGRVLASSDNAGRVALGMRVLARVDPGTARPYIMKYAKNGLEALSESKKGIAPELSGETLSGKDERLRLAAVRAAAECADPEFLRPFKRAVAGWHPSSSANPIVAKLQEDLEQEILVALCLMGDGKAAASVVQLMIQHDLAIEHNLDITQRPMYNRTPEKVRERKRARAQIAMLKARNRRLKAILARFPKSGIPRLSASAKEWQPLGSGYLQACLAVKEEEALGPASQKALQKILRECHLPDIRALCALQLRKADEAQFAETVLALSDSDRQSALFAISQMPHIQVTFRVRVIETALKRENQAVRTRAAWAILLAPVDQQRRLLKMAGTVGAEDPDFKRVLKCVEKLLENK